MKRSVCQTDEIPPVGADRWVPDEEPSESPHFCLHGGLLDGVDIDAPLNIDVAMIYITAYMERFRLKRPLEAKGLTCYSTFFA